MLPFRLIYHPGYDLHLGEHVFPSQKYRLIRERLLGEGLATGDDFLTPEPATDQDLLLVHEPGWIERLSSGALTYLELQQMEIPWSREMVEGFRLATGGTILAARRALEDGVGFNLGGGFHHAFPGHGEGFCAVHDVAVAIRRLQQDSLIQRALVVDCDVHHGNGTAAIFAGDPAVFTVSIHQWNNYPSEKPPSTIDIHLADGTGDQEYLDKLDAALLDAWGRFTPDLVFYVAGADPYRDDQLGGLSLTIEGLARRDRLALEAALGRATPVAVTLAGGYALRVEDTVAIHLNTVEEARKAKSAFTGGCR